MDAGRRSGSSRWSRLARTAAARSTSPSGCPTRRRRAACRLRWLPAGTLRMTTVGRRSGKTREAILGYYQDGPNIVTLAMNGWAAPEPAWWLNLQARPDVTVVLADGPREVHARAADGPERDRLWERWGEFGDNYEAYARLRPTGTAVVVLEPRSFAVEA